MDCSPPGSSLHSIFQANIPGWVAISFYRGSSRPRNWTWVSHTASRLFTVWVTRESLYSGHMLFASVPNWHLQFRCTKKKSWRNNGTVCQFLGTIDLLLLDWGCFLVLGRWSTQWEVTAEMVGERDLSVHLWSIYYSKINWDHFFISLPLPHPSSPSHLGRRQLLEKRIKLSPLPSLLKG